MKKIFIVLFISTLTLSVFGQNKMSKVVFVFNNITEFTNNFANDETPKEYNFKIQNLSDKSVQTLTDNISGTRGVESFNISDKDENGDRKANLIVYKYADHWKYYQFLFSRNGINKILINNKEYTPVQIGSYK